MVGRHCTLLHRIIHCIETATSLIRTSMKRRVNANNSDSLFVGLGASSDTCRQLHRSLKQSVTTAAATNYCRRPMPCYSFCQIRQRGVVRSSATSHATSASSSSSIVVTAKNRNQKFISGVFSPAPLLTFLPLPFSPIFPRPSNP